LFDGRSPSQAVSLLIVEELEIMSEPNSDITNEARRNEIGIVAQPPQPILDKVVPLPPTTSKPQRLPCDVLVCLLVACLLLLSVGLTIVGVAKVRYAAYGRRQMTNVKEMVLAVNTIAGNTTTGDIPPVYGEFPAGSGQTGSFFYHLLPYLWDAPLNLYNFPRDVPVSTYIHPADPWNPGTNSTISYASNGTLLNGKPRLPSSFGGRTSGMIVVMERSGLGGAHKWINTNNSLGVPDSPPPLPQFGVSPLAYLDGSPQALTSAGCQVGMGDGSARMVSQASATAGWSWACDPTDTRNQPSGW
jgi:hypothetical protein